MKKIIFALFVFALTGCVSSGVQVSQNAAMQFKEGVTTEAEIVAKLGPPTGTTVSSQGRLISYAGFQSQAKAASFIPIVGVFAGGADYTMTTTAYQIDLAGVMQKATYSTTGGSSRMGSTPVEVDKTEPRAVK